MTQAEELTRAAARNHVSWFSDNARAAAGSVRRHGGTTIIHSPSTKPDDTGEVILAFPEEAATTVSATIEAALALAREAGVRQVSCWSLLPTQPPDLAVHLLARGFQWGWQPHWMALDLSLPLVETPLPEGVLIRRDEGEAWDETGIPYYDPAEAARLQSHLQRQPARTFHFGAWESGRPVGHSLVHLSDDGIAGLYNVGVLPEARGRGIGRAVSAAACAFARAQGCRWALLNAATHIYTRLGFVSLGLGQTWWLYPPTLLSPPTPEQVAFVEALGRGDMRAAGGLVDLDTPLPCKQTPLELTASLQQPEAARWLLGAGATPELLPLWDLGWRDHVATLLQQRPELVNRCLAEGGKTPLHEAVLRNDLDLVRLLLTARPDLEIRDRQFNGTPLGWAQHLGRTEAADLIAHDTPGTSGGKGE